MGVRGLTGFIARNAEQYLTPFELHDCSLVIDGDNLACNLYKDATGIYSAFGGDYDDFYRAVVDFFRVLFECNIKPYVLMDGGYEHRKLRTVGKRLRGKIAVIKRINPCGSIPVFPLMMKEVFVDAVRDCGVPVMRCVFEADDELAALSRKLNCPVLSYDSDFYIHNVLYIPLITLTVKAHTKYLKESSSSDDTARKLRKNEAKRIEKRAKGNRIMESIVVDNQEKARRGPSYKYLDCCVYRIENLIKRGSLSKEKLPLFAAMLGNDYISRSCFKNFFLSGMGKIGRSRKTTQQQRRIKMILQWLKNESSESAMNKILSRLKKNERESLQAQIEAATKGYSNEVCRSYDFFKAKYDNVEEDPLPLTPSTGSTSDGEDSAESEEEFDDTEDEIGVESQEAIDCNGNEQNAPDENSCATESDDDPDMSDAQDTAEELDDDIAKLPQWFLEKLYPAHLPRFFVDLMHLRKYLNNPQIEHFPFNDCNEVALPILSHIYSLLNNVKGNEFRSEAGEGEAVAHPRFTYITRASKITNVLYVNVEVKEAPKVPFDPLRPDPGYIREVFEQKMPELNVDLLFSQLPKIPEDLQLYFLSLVYWLHRSQHCDLIHLQACLICLVVLRTVDSTIPPERDLKAFQKRFGKIIKRERQVRDKEAAEGVARKMRDDLKTLPIPERMAHIPKSDCYLVQNDMLKHFHIQEIFKKKYDLYSSAVLHGLAELQSVVFQLHSLNALLDFPYCAPAMCQLYSGVFLYNLYDLLKSRLDVDYYVRNFIFKDSQMMFDFYKYLWQWCEQFLPSWKRAKNVEAAALVNRKLLKKKRRQARSKEQSEVKDPYADMLSGSASGDDAEFVDLNNKFCNILKIQT